MKPSKKVAKHTLEPEFRADAYIPLIDAILEVTDSDKMSPKRVRRAVGALYGRKFKTHKEEMNKLILERYYILEDKREEETDESQDLKAKIKKLEEENRLLSAQINQGLQASDLQSSIEKRRLLQSTTGRHYKKRRHWKRKAQKNTVLSKKQKITPALAEFFGTPPELSRIEAVQLFWKYVKEHNLQNPDNRREIICDDRMKPVFGDRIGMFETSKVLSRHFVKPEEDKPKDE